MEDGGVYSMHDILYLRDVDAEGGVSMSLGIVFKGPEGIVLCADSRVTLTSQIQGMTLPSSFDNATKLLRVNGHNYVGIVTYGLGALGAQEPRTAHSFMPEFEHEMESVGRLSVQQFAEKLSQFFMKQWDLVMPKDYQGPPMIFLIAGYDADAAYGRVFQIQVPQAPIPNDMNPNTFGIVWGGQREITDRVLQGFDQVVPTLVREHLGLSGEQTTKLSEFLRNRTAIPIPYQFLPLQDCVNLCIFLVRTTIVLQTWMVGVRGVGGFIDVATVTRTGGFNAVQQKTIVGEGSRITLTQNAI